MIFREPTAADHLAISTMAATTFDDPQVAQLLGRLRAEGDMGPELIAVDEKKGRILGHIAFAKLREPQGWLNLAPVSVVQEEQGKGIGAELIRYGLDKARQAKAQAVVVVGQPRYYSKFGFSVKAAEKLVSDLSHDYTLLYPIAPGTSGRAETLVFPPAFTELWWHSGTP